MSDIRIRAFVCALILACVAACASSPSNGGARHATVPGGDAEVARQPESQCTKHTRHAADLVELNVDSTLPMLGNQDDDDLFSGDLQLGIGAERLEYEATYSLERGDILSMEEPDAANPSAPSRFGGQHLGQNVRLELPALTGAPLSLDVSSEFSDSWMVSGYSRSRHERAKVNWSPGPASVDVQWSGASVPFDPTAALACNLLSTVRLPTHESDGHSEGIVLSGGDCTVSSGDTPFAGSKTQAWGLGYEWSRPGRNSEAMLKVIDPVRPASDEYEAFEPGYELGLTHRRDFGPLSATAAVLLREASLREHAAPAGADGASWATNTALTWKLPNASLSASWAKGMDPLWFTPDVGERRDSFGLALNLSQWMAKFLPEVSSPMLAMNWNWSREYLPAEETTGNSSMRLDVAMRF